MNLRIDCQKITAQLIDFIKKTVKDQGFKKVIVGLSGGVDSSTVLNLAVKALGKENVLGAILPYGELNKKEVEHAFLMVDLLKIPAKNIFTINIKPIIDSFLRSTRDISEIRKGNIMARVRMILLFDLAKKHQALVCGTENKSERLLGYYTRFGDEASDLEPLRSLYKVQVRQLAEFLKVPEKIINQPPSAGLWPGQTDEKELGFSYHEADPILFYFFDKKYSWEKIISLGFEKKLVAKVEPRLKKNEFKKHVPYLPKI